MNLSHYDSSSAPTCEHFMASDKFIRFVMGPFGSGKSTAMVHEIVRRACMQAPEDGVRKSRWAIVRNTYPQLRDSTIRTFLDWYPDGIWGQYKVAEHEYHMKFRLDDDTEVNAEILFRALDGPGQIGNLLSVEYTGAWLNEAREISFEVYEAIQGRLGRYPSAKGGTGPTWDGLLMDSNPPDVDHWLYNVFEVIKPSNAEAFYQPSGLSDEAENIENLKPGYYPNMRIGKSPDWVKVYIEGQYGFVREGKPVYGEYNDEIHCKPVEYNPKLELIRGWDFGRHPACLYVQIDNRGRLCVLDELVAEGMGIESFAKLALDHTKQKFPDARIDRDIGDPSGSFGNEVTETTPFSVLWDLGVRIEEGVQDLDIRISSVKARLTALIDGKPAFIIDPTCNVTRKGFIGGYCYRRMNVGGGEKYSDKPDKQGKYSHSQDCLQYICTRMFDTGGTSKPHVPRVLGMMR